MNEELYHMPLNKFVRRVYDADYPPVPNPEVPSTDLMKRISDAELVRVDCDIQSDDYHAVYVISPEATSIRFDVEEGSVRISGFGTNNSSINETRDKIEQAFRHQ